jgi:dCTP deaminase
MNPISYTALLELVERGVIEGVDPSNVNGASIDVTLGPVVWGESPNSSVVDLARKQAPRLERVAIDEGGYILAPGEFILAQTVEVFNLPDDIAAEFRLKSSSARAGLDQALAVWCDPGWNGSVLTLELRNNTNYHPLRLTPGMKIGQMVFWHCDPVPEHASYRARGQYCGDREAQPSKGIR